MRLVPINRSYVEVMLRDTKLFRIIDGVTEVKYDKEFPVSTIMRLSALVQNNDDIEEIDINPLFLFGD